MRWVERVPASAIPCGEGTFRVQADSTALAQQLAKIAESAYVTGQLSEAVSRALRGSPDLAKRLAPLPTPELVYRLGDPTGPRDGAWDIPFSAYAIPREPHQA